MSGSFSQQLEELLNPKPKFADPEDDNDELTKAKVIDTFDEQEQDVQEDNAPSALRKRNALSLLGSDKRYLGKAVSRKQLMMDTESEDDDDDDDDREDDNNMGDLVEDGDVSGGDEGVSDDDVEDDEDFESTDEVQQRDSLRFKVPKSINDDLTFPREVDFEKLVEGMDSLGDDSQDESEGGEEDEEDRDSEDENEDDDGKESVRTFSQDKIDEEVERGKAVKNQLALWDQLLEARIKIQKALVSANQLPQQATFPEFKSQGGATLAGALKNSHKAFKALQRSLLELQDQLLYQNPDTRSIGRGMTWGEEGQVEVEEIHSDIDQSVMNEDVSSKETRPLKRKLQMVEYPEFMAKRFAAFQPYSNAKLQMWHDKTKLTTGKSSKDFNAFERNILTQVEQVLMDKSRLLRRTQTRRSEYRILGKPEGSAPITGEVPINGEDAEQQIKANPHLKDLDEDIFDDDDFYHQLLRELIERKTSASDPNDQVAMGKQWLAIQKLRSKIKKKVDTKASKGRKVRFHIHSKLVNFMAPIDNSTMSDEAKSELYRGLFGKNVKDTELCNATNTIQQT